MGVTYTPCPLALLLNYAHFGVHLGAFLLVLQHLEQHEVRGGEGGGGWDATGKTERGVVRG